MNYIICLLIAYISTCFRDFVFICMSPRRLRILNQQLLERERAEQRGRPEACDLEGECSLCSVCKGLDLRRNTLYGRVNVQICKYIFEFSLLFSF